MGGLTESKQQKKAPSEKFRTIAYMNILLQKIGTYEETSKSEICQHLFIGIHQKLTTYLSPLEYVTACTQYQHKSGKKCNV